MTSSYASRSSHSHDVNDPLARLRSLFVLPQDTVYLDGNSLGAMPLNVTVAVDNALQKQWGHDLIASWNAHSWFDLPVSVGERIALLIGAAPGQVLCVDSISVNLFKLLTTALALQPERKVMLCAAGDFPTDAYIAQGVAQLLGAERCELRRAPVDDLLNVLNDEVAVLILTHVNYRTGERYDMQRITEAAHAAGALVLWDLAHSAGAMPLALDDLNVDMAVGCGYKYFNGGPGSPAFLYVNQRHQNRSSQPLSGWLGHSDPFAFDADYRPGDGVRAFQAGTPAILSMTALNAALDVFDQTDLLAIRDKSIALTAFFMAGLETRGLLAQLECVTPGDPERRGSQVSLRHAEAWGISQALIDANVIVDFRAPDIVRFGFAPLYNSFSDAEQALDTLDVILRKQRFADPRFSIRPAVT